MGSTATHFGRLVMRLASNFVVVLACLLLVSCSNTEEILGWRDELVNLDREATPGYFAVSNNREAELFIEEFCADLDIDQLQLLASQAGMTPAQTLHRIGNEGFEASVSVRDRRSYWAEVERGADELCSEKLATLVEWSGLTVSEALRR